MIIFISLFIFISLSFTTFSQDKERAPQPDKQKLGELTVPPPQPVKQESEKLTEKTKEPGKKLDKKHMKHNTPKDLPKILDYFSDEEREQLKELFMTNPAEFKKVIQYKISEYKRVVKEDDQKIIEYVKKYNETKELDKRAEYRGKIREITRQQFDRKMKGMLTYFENTSKRLDELRRKIEVRQKNADIIIDKRVTDLLKDPELKW